MITAGENGSVILDMKTQWLLCWLPGSDAYHGLHLPPSLLRLRHVRSAFTGSRTLAGQPSQVAEHWLVSHYRQQNVGWSTFTGSRRLAGEPLQVAEHWPVSLYRLKKSGWSALTGNRKVAGQPLQVGEQQLAGHPLRVEEQCMAGNW